MRIVRSTLIGTAVAMALFGRHGVALADSPAAPAGSPAAPTGSPAAPGASDQNAPLEEIVVTSYRRSLETAMEAKRDATGVQEVLSAEDVGKFPDKNLAEALQRVPGIVTQRDFGEGERINLRGLLPTLTKATLNGHSLASADWFILDQQNATRSFNYLILPADLIGTANVVKSAQADIEEGGIAGSIDVKTRKPLDLENLTAYASMEASYVDTSGKAAPYATGLISFKDKDSTVGFLLAGIYQETHLRRDGFEILGYQSLSGIQVGSNDQTLVPRAINQALFEQDRIREGGNFDLQVKPTDQLEINFSGLLSILQAENFNNSWYSNASQGIGQGGTFTDRVIVDGAYVAGTVVSKGGGTDPTGSTFNYDSFHRFAKTTSTNLDLNVRYTPDQWVVTGDIGYTQGTGNTNPQYFIEFEAPGAFHYDLTKGITQHPIPNAAGHTVSFANPADFNFNFANDDIFTNDDRESYGYLDAERKLDLGILKSIKFGAKLTDHQRDADALYTNGNVFSAPLVQQYGNNVPFFAGGTTPSNWLSGISSPGSITQAWRTNPGVVQDILSQQQLAVGRLPYPIQGFSVNEQTYGTYVMGSFADSDNKWRGNVGVRIAHTRENTSGALVVPTTEVGKPGVIVSAFTAPAGFRIANASKTYNDVLPSLNFTYNVTPEFLARFSAAKVMARPDFNSIVPLVNLNPGALSGNAGNPALNPYRAWQGDLSFEWYPNRDTAYTLALFYKKITSFVESSNVVEQFNVQNATSPTAKCTTITAGSVYNCPFNITSVTNTNGGKAEGAELGITQPIWGGFGVTANYSYVNTSLNSGQPFPGTSKNTYNLTVFYENRLLSARASWTQRSAFFLGIDRASNLFEDTLTQLDLSASYNITSYLAATFEAQNLLDNKVYQYDNTITHPSAIYDNGRVFFAGFKAKF